MNLSKTKSCFLPISTKQHLFNIVSLIYELFEIARTKGILEFEEYIKTDEKTKKTSFILPNNRRPLRGIEEKFAIYFLLLITNGIENDTIRNLADNIIEYSSVNKKTKLFMRIFSSGIINIQRGQSPKLTTEYAASFIGIDAVSSCQSIIEHFQQNRCYNN